MTLKFLPLAAAALLASASAAFAQPAPAAGPDAHDVPTCSAAVTDHCISRPAAHHGARHARHHARKAARHARHHARHARRHARHMAHHAAAPAAAPAPKH